MYRSSRPDRCTTVCSARYKELQDRKGTLTTNCCVILTYKLIILYNVTSITDTYTVKFYFHYIYMYTFCTPLASEGVRTGWPCVGSGLPACLPLGCLSRSRLQALHTGTIEDDTQAEALHMPPLTSVLHPAVTQHPRTQVLNVYSTTPTP